MFQSATVRRISRSEKRVFSSSSIAVGGMRENFGDVPMTLSHGGRRSLREARFCRVRAGDVQNFDAGVKHDAELAGLAPGEAERHRERGLDGSAGSGSAHRCPSRSAAEHDRLGAVDEPESMVTPVALRGPVGSPATVSRSSATSSVKRAPIPIGNARLNGSPTDRLPGGFSLRTDIRGTVPRAGGCDADTAQVSSTGRNTDVMHSRYCSIRLFETRHQAEWSALLRPIWGNGYCMSEYSDRVGRGGTAQVTKRHAVPASSGGSDGADPPRRWAALSSSSAGQAGDRRRARCSAGPRPATARTAAR